MSLGCTSRYQPRSGCDLPIGVRSASTISASRPDRIIGLSMVIRIATWRPRTSGRGGNAASPPRKCRRYSLVCSYVPIPSAAYVHPGDDAARPLRARPVRVEPGGRAAPALAPRPGGRSWLPGAVSAAHRRPRGAPVAGCRLPDGAAAGAAGLRSGRGELLRRYARPPVVAQGRARRGVPDRSGQARARASTQPENWRGMDTEGRVAAISLVPCPVAGGEVLSGDTRQRRALAYRLRRDPRTGSRAG